MSIIKYSICFVLLCLTENCFCKERIPAKKSYAKPNDATKSVLFEDNVDGHRMVEMIYSKDTSHFVDCFLYGDKKLAKISISNRLNNPEIRKVSKQDLSDLFHQCSQLLLEKINNGEIENYLDKDFPEQWNNKIDRSFFDGLMIFPGTKWCGAGDIAEDYDDLGSEIETDICCRQHDHCFDYVERGQTKYNLTNKAIHTKSHCYCDEEFKDCLKSTNTSPSKVVATLYFNLIQIQCFLKEHPIIKCLEYKGIPLFWKSCQRYELDYKQQMLYQFFDAKFA